MAALLAEAQEQLRAARRRGEVTRGLMPSVAAAAGLLPASLHREMHSSVYSELSLDSGIGDPLAQLVFCSVVRNNSMFLDPALTSYKIRYKIIYHVYNNV